jgi:ectoine hydroxylase-related dioxygenase (phytanoyl-CoA dioxygenase family)
VPPSPELLAAYRRDGFAVVRDAVPRERALSMRAPLQEAVTADLAAYAGNPHYGDHWMVHNLMVRGDPFLEFLDDPGLHETLAAFFDPNCIIYAYTSSSMPPRGTNYSRRVHVDCPRFIPGYTTNVGYLLALDDFTDENGATWCLPGSHLSDRVPTEEEFYAGAVRWRPRAGDAVVFDARLFHAGGENTTDRPRHAITMNLCRSYMRQRFDYPRLVPPELIARLGPGGRRLVGMNVRVPTSLDEYYVPPERRLYLAGQG